MTSIKLAPVVIFVYNRPTHTQATIDALRTNDLAPKTDLIIYADAAKNIVDEKKVSEVRQLIQNIQGFNSVTIIERNANYGLARNIIEGVTAACERYGKVIVLEDDIVTSPAFLQYMNNALNHYSATPEVWHISGWNYPIDHHNLPDTFLWREMNCWGWGTWHDRWKHYKKDPQSLIQTFSKDQIKKFNLDGHHRFWDQVLGNQNNTINTWAIFWYASIFIHNGLCLNPTVSMVENIGFDDSGENCGDNNVYLGKTGKTAPMEFPIVLTENKKAVARIKRFYRKLRLGRLAESISWLLPTSVIRNMFRAPMLSLKSNIRLILKFLKRKHAIGIKCRTSRNLIALNKEPLFREFGIQLGTPIDRFYIDAFLASHTHIITGDVLEVADNAYTKKYGASVKSSSIFSYEPNKYPNCVIGDLTLPDTLEENKYDCFICTQTLNFIFDIKNAADGIYRLLKKDGIALITVAGLTQISRYDMDRWGDYWRLTTKSAQKLFGDTFGEHNIEVDFYGNALAATLLIQGVPAEEMLDSDINHKDKDYQVIITIVARKAE